MAPRRGKRKRSSVAASPTRSTCSICRSRKSVDEFPTKLDGLPSLATCTACLQDSLPTSNDWEDVGLRPPSSLTPSEASSEHDITPADVECHICVETKPITDFPVSHFVQYTGAFARLGHMQKAMADPYTRPTPLPIGCDYHLGLDPKSLNNAICNSCIASHLTSRMESLGAEHVSCIVPKCKESWTHAALFYLPKEMHGEYHKQLFEVFWYQAEKWECPDGKCNCTGMFMAPRDTPGYPRVECYDCKKQFCGLCRVPWARHQGMTCQEYRTEHPEVESTAVEDDETLRSMAELGAKRCPRCQWIILKEDGCNGIYCTKCHAWFDYATAEQVLPPGEEGKAKKEELKKKAERRKQRLQRNNERLRKRQYADLESPSGSSDDDGEPMQAFVEVCEIEDPRFSKETGLRRGGPIKSLE
ncbi:hypothetical protein K491DRAFT_760512 [Lophiostoma macrostomum CBS 122681]|uniref:RBR-type E3 ubiquitin transferase n=1 Tax=Lophiostoma macrostomum CBS 122681 TaxID=1314788 RepID=A0A6A6SXK0_9PLEO|nr:hypothetical protein K491DRAFT_760512 [Lophiostoma macrostomum CBS 122681]